MNKLAKLKKFWANHSVLEWCAAAVGVFTIIFVLLAMFTSLTDNAKTPTAETAISVDDPGFISTLGATENFPVEPGAPITILTNGQEFLPDLLSEVQNAKQSIYMTDYIWDGGTFGNTLLQALVAKAHQGVQVRLLLDGISGSGASKDYLKQLTDAGGKVDRFRPVAWWDLPRIDGRTHVRDFVIDDRIAYIGGIAISDNWLGDATSSTSWHDYMFKLQGPMASDAARVFDNLWSQTTGESLSFAPATATPSATQFVSLFSTPGPDLSSNLQHFFWLSIEGAQKSVHIENPYFTPSRPLIDALKSKAQAGVDVEIIVSGDKTDAKETHWASQSFYSELIAAGVKVYEYQASRIHAKTMVVDGKWSVIGSANLDNRSSEINLEYIMGVMDPTLAQSLETHFTEDRGKSKEITQPEWSRTSLLMAPLQLVSRLFSHQF